MSKGSLEELLCTCFRPIPFALLGSKVLSPTQPNPKLPIFISAPTNYPLKALHSLSNVPFGVKPYTEGVLPRGGIWYNIEKVHSSGNGALLMPPKTPRDFLKVAAQKLITGETLLREKLTLDAQYLGGYTVECSLKALILHQTPDPHKPDMLQRLTIGAKMHRSDVLLGELRNKGVTLPLEIAKRMRRFDWTTDLRYETGRRDTGETIAFLKTAKAIDVWVEGQIP